MKRHKLQSFGLSALIATAALSGSIVLGLPAQQVNAQTILQERGRLEPMQGEYTFSGRAGQAVTITMTSEDFDTILVLLDPRGQEIAVNDDYGRTLNSTIVATLPQNGVYKILARSFSGQGGNYSVAVRPATAYEQAYNRALTLLRDGNTEQAIAAYTEAIRVDPNQPIAYLERADARFGLAVNSLIDPENPPSPENPIQLSDAQLAPILADYQRAIEIYERAGDAAMAQMVREQMNYIQNPESMMP